MPGKQYLTDMEEEEHWGSETKIQETTNSQNKKIWEKKKKRERDTKYYIQSQSNTAEDWRLSP